MIKVSYIWYVKKTVLKNTSTTNFGTSSLWSLVIFFTVGASFLPASAEILSIFLKKKPSPCIAKSVTVIVVFSYSIEHNLQSKIFALFRLYHRR